MPNMYTCIAYLVEIRKFCSKNLVYKGVNFEAQNALKLSYEHLQFLEKIPGGIPRTPVKRVRGRGGEKGLGWGGPQFTFLATPLASNKKRKKETMIKT